MRYFNFEQDEARAVETWNNAQFDLADIVLFLTDNGIMLGAKIYAVFNRVEVKNLLKYFIFDFDAVKKDLNISEYVEHEGEVFSKSFNPKRKSINRNISKTELEKKAEFVYWSIINDLKIIAKKLQHFV